MWTTNCLRVCMMTAASLALVACSTDTSTPSTAASAAQAGATTPNAAWVQSPQKHNNSGIAMRYRIDGALAVGKPVTVWLEFAGAQASDARVSVSPAKTLLVGTSEGMQKNGEAYQLALKPNDITSRAMTVTPSGEGEHFINVQLAQNGLVSAAGVMLRVGQMSAVRATPGEIVTSGSGEKLIVMPAK